jgi:DNA-binding beta-propeller fold protein YncE
VHRRGKNPPAFTGGRLYKKTAAFRLFAGCSSRFNRQIRINIFEGEIQVKKLLGLAFAFLIAFVPNARSQEKPPLKLVATTPLPDFTGDFDHFAVDLKGKRLFLTAEDHKTVEVFDLEGKRIHSITGFGQPHAAVVLSDSNIIVTDGDDFGRVALVNGKDYKIMNSIKLPNGVDGAVFNPVNQYYYVESGSDDAGAKTHVINIIDTKAFKLVGEITLPGNHSEAMAIDRAGKKMYINLTGADQVGVVDLDARKLIAQWPVPDAQTANALVLDEPNHRLFIATRKPAKFFVYDTDTGKVVTTLPTAEMHDDMWFDLARKRIYVTGTETTAVMEQRDADHYSHLADVPTGYRAKTSIYVPELNRLYIAVSGKGRPDPKMALQVFDVQP